MVSALKEEIGEKVQAGRRVMDQTLHVVETQVVPALKTRRAQIASGVVLLGLVTVGIGVLVVRRGRRRTLASRLQRYLGDARSQGGELGDALVRQVRQAKRA